MINLGSYSGKNCPEVRYRPTALDRILEGAALFILLATWVCIYWLYTRKGGALSPNVWVMGGTSVFTFIIMGISSYLPVRFFNFPVRVNERNIVIQYLLAVRLTRVMNIIMCLTFLSAVFLDYYKIAFYFFIATFALLILAFIGYYVLAFRYPSAP